MTFDVVRFVLDRITSSHSLGVYFHPVFLGCMALTLLLERRAPARP